MPSINPNLAALRPTSLSDAARILGTANQFSLGPLKAGSIGAFLANSPVGDVVGQVGMKFAASAGNLVKGIFVWKDQDGTVQNLVFHMNPEEINDKSGPEYAKHMVPGQNRPQYHFLNGGERTISFTLNYFYRDRDRAAIADSIEQLRSLTLRPDEVPSSNAAKNGPPAIYFTYGRFYQGKRLLVTSLSVKAYDLFDPSTLLPMRAAVEIELVDAPDPYSPIRLLPQRGQTLTLRNALPAAF